MLNKNTFKGLAGGGEVRAGVSERQVLKRFVINCPSARKDTMANIP